MVPVTAAEEEVVAPGVPLGAMATASVGAEYLATRVAVGLNKPGRIRTLWTTNAIRKPTRRRRKKAYLPKSYRPIARGDRLCDMRYFPLISGFEDDGAAVTWTEASLSTRFTLLTLDF